MWVVAPVCWRSLDIAVTCSFTCQIFPNRSHTFALDHIRTSSLCGSMPNSGGGCSSQIPWGKQRTIFLFQSQCFSIHAIKDGLVPRKGDVYGFTLRIRISIPFYYKLLVLSPSVLLMNGQLRSDDVIKTFWTGKSHPFYSRFKL